MATSEPPVDSVLVIGCGLIGTSVALALRERGVAVHLADRDAAAVRTAAARGAGSADQPPGPVDVAVVAVTPSATAAVVADALERGLAGTVTDTASVKGPVLRAVHDRLDGSGGAAAYVGGHPMAGSERSGPEAARADLFAGRRWVLTPDETTDQASLARSRRLVDLCGGVVVERSADVHDHDVALVSHLPQVLASALASRFGPRGQDSLAGPGFRDMTRLAASPADLWVEILVTNRAAVLGALDAFRGELDQWVDALETATTDTAAAADALRTLLLDGNRGRARLDAADGNDTASG